MLAERILSACVFAFIISAFAGIILEIISLFFRVMYLERWVLILPVIGIAAALVCALLKRPVMRDAALYLDGQGMQERTVTALELMEDVNIC